MMHPPTLRTAGFLTVRNHVTKYLTLSWFWHGNFLCISYPLRTDGRTADRGWISRLHTSLTLLACLSLATDVARACGRRQRGGAGGRGVPGWLSIFRSSFLVPRFEAFVLRLVGKWLCDAASSCHYSLMQTSVSRLRPCHSRCLQVEVGQKV